MLYALMKAALSGVIIMIVSETAKRSPALGALIVSLPLVSILSILWLWRDTGDVERIAAHAQATFWYVVPTLPMFLVLPAMLRGGCWLLAESGRGVPADGSTLFDHALAAAEIRHQRMKLIINWPQYSLLNPT